MSEMFPLWMKIIFVLSGILGLFLLIKSISKIVALYNNPNSVEFSALLPSTIFEIKEIGAYEIAVKRPSLFGMIPTGITFRLVDLKSNIENFLKGYSMQKGYEYISATSSDDNVIYYKDSVRNITTDIVDQLNKNYNSTKKK